MALFVRVVEVKVSEGENSHAKNYSHGDKLVRVVCAAREIYRIVHKKGKLHTRGISVAER